MRVYPLAARPDQVVEAVEFGFDLFTGSYPFVITQNCQALVFESEMSDDNAEAANKEEEEYEVKAKKRKESIPEQPKKENKVLIDLKDKK